MFRQVPDFHFEISEVDITRVNCILYRMKAHKTTIHQVKHINISLKAVRENSKLRDLQNNMEIMSSFFFAPLEFSITKLLTKYYRRPWLNAQIRTIFYVAGGGGIATKEISNYVKHHFYVPSAGGIASREISNYVKHHFYVAGGRGIATKEISNYVKHHFYLSSAGVIATREISNYVKHHFYVCRVLEVLRLERYLIMLNHCSFAWWESNVTNAKHKWKSLARWQYYSVSNTR